MQWTFWEKQILTIVHERILKFGTGKSDGPEVVQHHPGSPSVHNIPQAQVGHPVQEGEDVTAGLLHGDHHNPVVLLGMVCQDGDDEVGVEWV